MNVSPWLKEKTWNHRYSWILTPWLDTFLHLFPTPLGKHMLLRVTILRMFFSKENLVMLCPFLNSSGFFCCFGETIFYLCQSCAGLLPSGLCLLLSACSYTLLCKAQRSSSPCSHSLDHLKYHTCSKSFVDWMGPCGSVKHCAEWDT